MSSLKSRSENAFFWDLLGNYAGQGISFVISILLARILSPEEFGLVGMSMVLVNILKIAQDMGLAAALVQNNNNSSLTYSSVFYINLVFGLFFSSAIFFSAPLVGSFYENDTITHIVKLLSISYFISSLYIVQSTILKIELDFKNLTLRDVGAQVGAGILAVIFALRGFGVMALVIQLIASELFKLVLIIKVSKWQPRAEFSWGEVKKLTSFSAYFLMTRFLGQVTKEIDTLAVGKLFTPAVLGYYTRANSLNQLINKNSSNSLTNVFFPVLSKVKHDIQKFNEIYLKIIEIISGISFFITGLFFLTGEQIIIGLFGEKWGPSVPIFQILVLIGFTNPISSMNVSAFFAMGKARENFYYGFVRKGGRLVPVFFAYFYGFDPFLYAIVGVSLFLWMFNNVVTALQLKIGFLEQFKPVFFSFLYTVVALGVSQLIYYESIKLVGLIMQLLIYVLIFLLLLFLTKSILIQEGYSFLKLIWKKLRVT